MGRRPRLAGKLLPTLPSADNHPMKNEAYMLSALDEARKAMGKTHPNPAVGAVVVHQDQVVARGFTEPAGGRHAEIVALDAFRESGHEVDESTILYVTMEPCSTHGRTPPCTSAIIESGIRQVVVGATDPNPDHAGRGFGILRKAGITVLQDVLADECEDLNLIFNWRMSEGRPLFAGKIATTLDGRIATRGGLSKWITGNEARADVHRWRRYFPAIAVGAGTVLADNPALTARIEGEEEWCPLRFIFDRHLITFKDGTFKVYSDAWRDRTIVVSSRAHLSRIRKLEEETGIRFWAIESGLEDGGLPEFAQKCLEEGIDGIFLEGGAHLLSSFLNFRHLDYLFAYRAPKLLADVSGLAPFTGQEPVTMQETVTLREIRQARFGNDQLMRGFVVYPRSGEGED